MSPHFDNRGVATFGGTTNVTNSAVGDGASVHVGHQRAEQEQPSGAWDVGIVTILPEETRAVLEVLGLSDSGTRGRRFYTGTLGGETTLVAAQAMGQGQQSIMATLGALRDRYDPAVFVLSGIGGAIHPEIAVDDVVVATRVVFYDRRKVLVGRTLRRGEEHVAPATVIHSINAFFTASGEPAALRSPRTGREFAVRCGPIGTGEAVVANPDDEIRRYLTAYNDKMLAVEMEAGGLAQFCHETTTKSGLPLGWAVVRGISDGADAAKDDGHHESAALNAAQTVRHLIPYLHPRR